MGDALFITHPSQQHAIFILYALSLTSQDEILENMRADEAQAGSGDFDDPGVSPRSRDLVAYW